MSELSESFDAGRRQKFRRQLQSWYASHQRDLPWRRERDPYAVWISEIMLQQTVVAAVIPYFKRFMSRFPDVETLAAADESEVLQHWEGLGYYSRARNIHKAARLIAGELEGNFPRDVNSLQTLPGIGRYTAGAICSFAYDTRAPIVEANTLRLYSRLIGLKEDPRSKSGQQQLWEFAELILPRKSPGEFNQALMDLGSLVCTPQNPNCEHCPVSAGCEAFLRQRQHLIPVPKARPEITPLTDVSIAVFSGTQVMIRQRTSGERWAGLWDFPRLTLEEMSGSPHPAAVRKKADRQKELFPAQQKVEVEIPEGLSPAVIPRLENYLKEQAGIEASMQQLITEIRHSVTRYKIRLLCFVAQLEPQSAQKKMLQLNNRPGESEYQWVSVKELESYPLSVTGRKFAKLLAERT